MRLVLIQLPLRLSHVGANLETILERLEEGDSTLWPEDIVLLPEGVESTDLRSVYERGVRDLARRLRCHVVGGTNCPSNGSFGENAGIVADPAGAIVGRYRKMRPYGSERTLVQAGGGPRDFTIGGRRIAVLICADFWFSDLFLSLDPPPEVILVPALSVSRKPKPDYARSLWHHLAVARAYEFGAYVGISDWAFSPQARPSGSGVAGFADPATIRPERFFSAVGDRGVGTYPLDFEALEAFRRDRVERGFFRQPGPR